jgi:hypothetical protein
MTRRRLDRRRSKGEGRERAPRPSLNLALRRMRLLFCDVDRALTAGRVSFGDGKDFTLIQERSA